MRQLRSVSTVKECVIIIKAIVASLVWRSTLMRSCSTKERIFSVLLLFCESVDKLQSLQAIKSSFAHMLQSCTDQRVQLNYFSFLLLDFISNWLLNSSSGNWVRYLSPLAELIVHSLSVEENYSMANQLLAASLETVSKEELKKIFELELIHSARLYQVFSDWYYQKFPEEEEEEKKQADSIKDRLSFKQAGDSLSVISPKNTNTMPTFRETASYNVGELLNNDSRGRMSDEKVAKYTELQKMRHELQNTPTSINLRRSFEQAFQSNSKRSDRQEPQGETSEFKTSPSVRSIELEAKSNFVTLGAHQAGAILVENQDEPRRYPHLVRGQHDTVDVPLEHEELAFAQLKSSINSEVSHGDPMRGDNGEKVQTQLAPVEQRRFEAPKQELVKEARSSRTADSDGSAEKWRDRYLSEKQKMQSTIHLLDKTQTDYHQKCSQTDNLLSKLEQQRRINEQLIDKFNE